MELRNVVFLHIIRMDESSQVIKLTPVRFWKAGYLIDIRRLLLHEVLQNGEEGEFNTLPVASPHLHHYVKGILHIWQSNCLLHDSA